MDDYRKKNINLPELLFKLPGITKDLPKILTALYYNYTVNPNTEISIGEIFNKTVRKYPDRPCIFYHRTTYTYQDFNEWVNRLANHFISLGIKKGDVIAVMLENRPEILAVSMAMAKIGSIAALINTAQRQQTLVHSFKLVKPKMILIGTEFSEPFLQIKSELEIANKNIGWVIHSGFKTPVKTGIQMFDIFSETFSAAEPKINERIHSKDAFLYIYTSGTTGLPKASIISHGRWIKGYSAFGLTSFRLTPEDILYVPLPFFHATAMIVCWSSVVAGGASMVIKNKFSVSEFWKDIAFYQATAFGYVGEMCKYLLNAPEQTLEKKSTLKKMIGNGLRPDIWVKFKARFGVEQVSEFYASSEGNIAFFNVFNLDGTMGFSITNYAIVEYDLEKGEPVRNKRGFMKEVPAKGTGLLLGEINDRYPFDGYTEKGKTEGSIFRNVLKKGDAYFNTNDLVRDMGFGHTQFVDRLGDTFRWKGENVSTLEVEGIINQFQGILESVVYGVLVPENSGRAGMALLILEDNLKQLNLEKFYTLLSKELPTYAIPLFLRIGKETQTTNTFKHQKHALKTEGYNINFKEERIYVLQHKKYIPLTAELKKQIDAGKVKF